MNDPPQPPPCWRGWAIWYDAPTNSALVGPLLCNRWNCPTCASLKARSYFLDALSIAPTHALTFTLAPPRPETIAEQANALTKGLRRVWRHLRTHADARMWLWTYELHQDPALHVHALAKLNEYPQRELSKLAQTSALGPVVWIKRISGSPRRVYHQIKYLWKSAMDSRAALLPRNRVHTSREWARAARAKRAATRTKNWQLAVVEPRHAAPFWPPPRKSEFNIYYAIYEGTPPNIRRKLLGPYP